MENEITPIVKPECPFCNNIDANCEHVLVDFDVTFMEYKSGFLLNNKQEIENLKSEIFSLLKSNHKPLLKEGNIKDIWDCAAYSFNTDSEEIDFDETAYFNFIDEEIYMYNGESFNYGDEDESPGYSSSMIIYFAENPKRTIELINKEIIEQLKL